MKLSKLLFACCALAGCMLFAGCSTTRTVEFETIAEADHEGARKAASGYGETIIKAMKDKDYKLFVSNMPEAHLKRYPEAGFQQMFKSLGDLAGAEFLTGLEHPMYYSAVWKLTFEKKGTDPANEGKKIRQDTLLRVMVEKLDGEYKIFGIVFN